MPFDCYCGCPLLWKGLLCSPNCLRSSSVPSGSSSECGSAVLSAAIPGVGIGLLGVSFAFGLTVLTGACALGSISGGHFNPAVSVGLWAGGRFPASHVLPYVIAQVVGGVVGAGVLYLIASGKADFSLAGGMASNGYAEHSPGQYSMVSGLFTEVVMTFMFLIVILGATHKRARRLRGPFDQFGADADPSHQHSGHQHLGQPPRAAPAPPSSSAAGRCSNCGCSGWHPSSARRLPVSRTRCFSKASTSSRQ